MERCIKCGEITVADTRDDQPTTWTTCPKCEYKPERANVPSRYTLTMLVKAYHDLEKRYFGKATTYLVAAKSISQDMRDKGNLDDLITMIANDTLTSLRIPIETMARIAEILTCGGRIYDEYSEFLRDSNA